MKRPKIIRPTRLEIKLPEDIRAKLDLLLFSTTEGRVPMGAYQRFFIARIQEFFKPEPKLDKNLLKSLMTYVFDNASQEWWVAQFQNPEAAYNAAKDFYEKLK